MARAKKEATLTPEERLQVALVPNWDWPYKLPENWCWTKIGSISSLHRGVSYKKTDAHTERRENSCLVMRGGNICEGSIDTEADNIYVDISLVAENQIVRKNDIIIVASTGSTKVIGRAGISKMDYLDVAFGAFLLLVRPSTKVNQRYIDYFFLSDNYRNRIKKLASGININNIRGEYITETLVPLAPLAEQQRIVDRIESLFTKLDEAKEKAQTVVDSFETRKAAILHKAFTGELTAKWREERGVGMESWHLRTIGEVCENVKVGIVIKPSQYYVPQNEGTPAFRSANVRECRIDDFDWVYLNEKGMKDNSRSIVHTGDVLVVRSGNPGTACVVPERFDGYNAIDILIAVPNKKIIISDYLCYYTNSPLGKKTVEIGKRGIALTHFNVKGFSQMPINIPTIPEQVVIVRTLGDLFAQEQQAKEAAEAVLDQIDLMKKSILARAFRGELGTNDPNEESAVELLRQAIKQENGNTAKKKVKTKRIVIPTEIKLLISNANEEAIIKLLLKDAPKPVSIQEIMSISKEKFELMDALQNLERKQIVLKCDFDKYSLMR